MRSRTGCLTCRQRKLKCSEEKPACAQCVKAQRECVPSSGITFRHQHNASMNGSEGDTGKEAPLGRYYSYKNTFDDDSTWVDIPKRVNFFHIMNPYEDPTSPEPQHLVPTPPQSSSSHEPQVHNDWDLNSFRPNRNDGQGLHILSAAAVGGGTELFSPLVPNGRPVTSYDGSHGSNRGSVQSPTSLRSGTRDIELSPLNPLRGSSLDFILGPSSSSPPIDPTLGAESATATSFASAQRTHRKSSSFSPRIMYPPEGDQEVAFLLRFFSEGPGLWMDLFDLGLYFSYYVPVKARLHPLLKYSAVALAAKALARTRGNKHTYGGRKSRLARTESYPDSESLDWDHKATAYYNTAISILRQRLTDDSAKDDDELRSASEGQDETEFRSQKRRRINNQSILCPNSVELLVSSAILGVYEFFDASNPNWSRHLNGARSLLDIAKERMLPYERGSSPYSPWNQSPLLKAKKATFWNIARQDMLAAYITNEHTRIDPNDLDLWREVGLIIDAHGFIESSNDDSYTGMKEDLISNGLIWLMMKLVNFMADGDDLPLEAGGLWSGVPQRDLLRYWCHLREQFQRWYDILPQTFFPPARLEPANGNFSETLRDSDDFPEVWFSIPMCAATMQHWHFSQILLLMNKPHESTQGRSTLSARFESYGTLVQESLQHSREIVSIALSQSEASIRVHGVQPLFTAGQCFKIPKDRQLVITLLREIEADTGWATEYRVQQLLHQWQQSISQSPNTNAITPGKPTSEGFGGIIGDI